MSKYQTIILDGNELASCDESVPIKIKSKLVKSGNVFVFFEPQVDENGYQDKNFFEYINLFVNADFVYLNTIVTVASRPVFIGNYRKNAKFILWFALDHDIRKFDKDSIREKHIWKDIEWGKRAKNYHPKGKDPGNVWIPTLDDGRGNITEHLAMSDDEIIKRCELMSCSQKDKTLIMHPQKVSSLKNFEQSDVLERAGPAIAETSTKNLNSLKIKCSSARADVFFQSSERMSSLKDESVDLMVTSPPYWDLKDYFKEGQIGQESYDQYLTRLNTVWKETWRALKKDGNMFININLRVKQKKPILIPLDIINQCKALGFNLVDIVVWHKSSGIPAQKTNLVDRHEYVLWFTKGETIQFNENAIQEISDYKNKKLNFGSLWNLNRKAGSVGSNFIHPAIYPNALVDRIVRLTTSEGDIVIDPFLGSGTSAISALQNNRSFIGYEFNEDFDLLIKHRITNELPEKSVVSFHYTQEKSDEDTLVYRKISNHHKSNQ